MAEGNEDTYKDFFLTLRRALLMVVAWIDKRYDRPSEKLKRLQ